MDAEDASAASPGSHASSCIAMRASDPGARWPNIRRAQTTATISCCGDEQSMDLSDSHESSWVVEDGETAARAPE
ncbi:MAG: hypothetical protein ACK4QW_19645, partial [Alphaproteobacteria bacterium]